ncbi:phosphoribosylanthranilate isomerase [Aurantiacibacter gangjinensis]|uniref:N-(5'-phosphoribosyl)anthranilate isomerase n=1 Tax=Aurantiacibacter gangjinensis TaxID=502682 RepID=A0A0G9MQ18_9SPHN|nr:phosphoribosylanthranilate isomerase [Aurantiacibacter gangjinensis]APE28447.1 Phosphoribosylanthranilate isomerase [Aurantiacibacter gangjinensis]KLE32659.1 N-(5'-phosphoribosyl)anthranilate isomerase [Aurantiacibacter gangjinensis]
MPEQLIKICGLTTSDTVDAAVDAGATHVGLVHFEKSPRHLSIADAAKLRMRVPDSVKVVLLTVNMEPQPTAEALQEVQPDVLQLHGKETPEWLALIKSKAPIEVWKAVGIKDRTALENAARFKDSAHRLLYDAAAGALPGGNGLALDWRLLVGHRHALPWGLAGGLGPSNVANAIRYTGAPLVDASSGLESEPGKKDIGKIRAFCEAALAARAEAA